MLALVVVLQSFGAVMLLSAWQVSYGQILTSEMKIVLMDVRENAAGWTDVYATNCWV